MTAKPATTVAAGAHSSAPPTRRSWAALLAGAIALLALVGEIVVYGRGDFDWLGGAFLLAVIAATAAGSLWAARADSVRQRTALLVPTAAVMWTFGLVGVFSPMFLLLLSATFATAAAIRAAKVSAGARGALVATALVAIGAATLTAIAVVVLD